jgi:hypothetical protein
LLYVRLFGVGVRYQLFAKLFILNSLFWSLSVVRADSVTFPEKIKKIYGSELIGGDSYEEASLLEFDKEFRLSHHQEKDYYDFFYVDLQEGQLLEVSAKTGDKGLRSSKENNSCRAGIQLHTSERTLIERKRVYGCFKKESIRHIAPKDGRYFLLVGDTSHQLHKDHVYYTARIVDLADDKVAGDAGNSSLSAIPIDIGEELRGNLSYGDQVDMYTFHGRAHQKIVINLRSENSEKYLVAASLKSEIGQVFQTLMVEGTGSAQSAELKLPIDGDYILRVRCHRKTKTIMEQAVPHGACFSKGRSEYKDYYVRVGEVESIAQADTWAIDSK